MLKLTYIMPDEKKIELSVDPEDKQSLLDIALDNDIDIDHSCGGNAACSTCHIKVVKGMELLNEIDDIEEDLIDFAEDADLNSRLACQCIPTSESKEITVKIPMQKGLH
jgi:ferredoxin, 2Fe-2S